MINELWSALTYARNRYKPPPSMLGSLQPLFPIILRFQPSTVLPLEDSLGSSHTFSGLIFPLRCTSFATQLKSISEGGSALEGFSEHISINMRDRILQTLHPASSVIDQPQLLAQNQRQQGMKESSQTANISLPTTVTSSLVTLE